MNDACPNCHGRSNLKVHWYRPKRSSKAVVYRCRNYRTHKPPKPKKVRTEGRKAQEYKDQLDAYRQTKHRLLQLWEVIRRQHPPPKQVPAGLWKAYRAARAAYSLALGALNEEFSKHTT